MPVCGGRGVGQSDRCWTATGYISVPTVLHSLLVGGIDYSQYAIVTCGRPKMANSVIEGCSHDESRGGRSVTGVQRGHETKV